MDLAAPDRTTEQGRRDHGVLLFLYNTAHAPARLAVTRFVVHATVTRYVTEAAIAYSKHSGALRESEPRSASGAGWAIVVSPSRSAGATMHCVGDHCV
jgi:hypothetical protein